MLGEPPLPSGHEAKFECFNAADHPHRVDAYLALKDRVLVTHGWALFNFDAPALAARRALVGAIMQGEQLLSALHIVIDGAEIAHVQGVVTDPSERTHGLCEATLRQTLDHLRAEGIKTAELTVRIKSDGEPNEAAFRAFTKVGFRPIGQVTVHYSGTFADRHLVDTCEGGEGSRFFRALVMRADLLSPLRSMEHV